MALAEVQSNDAGTTSATSLQVTLTGAATGNLVVVGIVCGGPTTTVNSVADTVNTYTRCSGRTFLSGAGGCEIWYAKNITGGNLTITVSISGTFAITVFATEYSGADTTAPFDVQATTSGTSTTPDSGSATTTAANEILAGMLSVSGATSAFTPGTGYTRRGNAETLGIWEDQIVSSTGSYSANGTLSSSQGWVACLATFKAAGGVVTVVQTPMRTMRGAGI